MLTFPLPAVFFVGCALLPWLWLVNVWLFWPAFWGKNGNAVVKRCKWQHLRLSTEACGFTKSVLPALLQTPNGRWQAAHC